MANTTFDLRRVRQFLGFAALVALSGCGQTDRIVANSSVPLTDYRARHPIVLSEARSSLDIFPSGSQRGLDTHSAKQIYAFASQYRDLGHGPVTILLPRGRSRDAGALLADIKRVLTLGGAGAGVVVSSYPVADPHLASTVRLSFAGTKAVVADQCGQWPVDLASASSIEGWENKPYWNLGCATQTMIAAQTSDPRDLVAPRGEDPADTATRDRAIKAVRGGTDPNTNWSIKNSSIGSVGGS